MATHTTQQVDDDADVKIGARGAAHIKELEHLADSLEEANLLYGSALDGMQAGLMASKKALAEYGLDERLTVAEEEIGKGASDVLLSDIEGMKAFDIELNADDAEEEVLLSDDQSEPQDIAA